MIATTGDLFSDFAPYVASVNDAGIVPFQATLEDGGTGVFLGSGGPVTQVADLASIADIASHPDLNGAGVISFYGNLSGGDQGVFLHRDGRLNTVADTRDTFMSIGPAGPTMNEAGMVAYRADRMPGVSGIFVWDGASSATVAETQGRWSQFYGLPVINNGGTVVFRADRSDGLQGVYAAAAGSIRTLAETGDRFEALAHFPSMNDRGSVAFAATLRSGGAGIFTVQDGRTIQVFDTGSAFESYRGALISADDAVIAIATPRGRTMGLYTGSDPETDRILGIGDSLFGSTVTELAANPVSVSAAGHLAIRVKLVDESQLILRVDRKPAIR